MKDVKITHMQSRLDEITKEAMTFHIYNPIVWTLFVKYTLDRINKGFKHYSVNGIFERLRWDTYNFADPAWSGEPDFKINNNFRPLYAKRFMEIYPEHSGFFRTRIQTSEYAPAHKKQVIDF